MMLDFINIVMRISIKNKKEEKEILVFAPTQFIELHLIKIDP